MIIFKQNSALVKYSNCIHVFFVFITNLYLTFIINRPNRTNQLTYIYL